MYPPISPHDHGMLTVDGAELYWESSGNPSGIPVLYLHGGPGGVLRPGYRRHFDPESYRIIGLQQRGAGASRPRAGTDDFDLAACTTRRLVADVEALREHLGIDSWLVSGISWGSTLALDYAVHHPDRVRGLVLVAVTTTSAREVDWISEGIQAVYPEAWEELAATVEQHTSWRRGQGRLVEAASEVMAHGDAAARAEVASAWMAWEATHVQVGLPVEQLAPVRMCEQPIAEQIAFTTLVCHFWAHHAAGDPEFVPTGGLMAALGALAGIPVCMVHGRRDVSGPVATAWAVKKALPGADLHVVEAEGHGGAHMMELWRRAADSFAERGDFSAAGEPAVGALR